MIRKHIAQWIFYCGTGMLLLMGTMANAQNSNGNDFALYFSEARHENEREWLLSEAGRRPHFFRYLQIMEMEEVERQGRREVRIIAMEPASAWDIAFTINQRVSLSTLDQEPASEPGRAIAVQGRIQRVDPDEGTIYLDPAIVRHKDRLSPKLVGREMLYEIDDRSIFYSFTGGEEAVSVSYRDRDLLRHRNRIMEEGGDNAWAAFLKREIARRNAARDR